ncbi:DUF4905 domain-containing protein [Fulvivirga maritima]|uniref:DUF4905 domain-containing protein n=1 Tax=Fulvivirga maritima TaxID=2904247 RepID=UPI001F405D0B|nr:DUF4905 domain-containing protein [Fulvivirga maritima]UII27275.1 DUF4905 domain-containing protein [Fulvivirga maritima]
MRKLNLNFSYLFEGKVWNIISSSDQSLLIEVRHPDQFVVEYSLLDLNKEAFVFEGLRFEENWWISAAHIHNDNALFYTYGGKDNPDYKDFFSYSISAEKVIWTQEDVRLLKAVNDRLLFEIKGKEEQLTLGLVSGNEVGSIVDDEHRNKSIVQPFYYQQNTKHFETVHKFIQKKWQIESEKGVHYFENETFVIISYYYAENKGLTNNLVVMDRQGNLLLQEVIGKDLPGIADDTFFIYDDQLIFVKENSELFVYQLLMADV